MLKERNPHTRRAQPLSTPLLLNSLVTVKVSRVLEHELSPLLGFGCYRTGSGFMTVVIDYES